MYLQDKYTNLFTDFGFKRLFGEEPNKDLLISFLNTLLPDEHQIQTLQYGNNERQGNISLDRKAYFDLYCTSNNGERFIVELQKAKHNFFKERSIYYTSFPIQEQAKRGEWDYYLAPIYMVGILDFIFDERGYTARDEVIHTVQLKNQHGQVFYDKLTYIYLTLPNFNKTAQELDTLQDKWLYLFRHLHQFEDRPHILHEHIFGHLFEVAQITQFNDNEMKAYIDSLKNYRDMKGVTDTAWGEGHEEGKKNQTLVIAKSLLTLLDDATIAQHTGLSLETVQQLRADKPIKTQQTTPRN